MASQRSFGCLACAYNTPLKGDQTRTKNKNKKLLSHLKRALTHKIQQKLRRRNGRQGGSVIGGGGGEIPRTEVRADA